MPSGCDVAYTRLEKDGPKTGVGGGWKSVAWHDGYSPGPVVYPAMLSGPSLLHCTLSCGEVYCNRPCLFVCGCVCGSVTTTTQNCVRRSSPNFELVRKGSNHLQLVKFWPSRTPGKGVCGGAKFFGSALIQAARSVCFFQSCFPSPVVSSLVRNILWAPFRHSNEVMFSFVGACSYTTRKRQRVWVGSVGRRRSALRVIWRRITSSACVNYVPPLRRKKNGLYGICVYATYGWL